MNIFLWKYRFYRASNDTADIRLDPPIRTPPSHTALLPPPPPVSVRLLSCSREAAADSLRAAGADSLSSVALFKFTHPSLSASSRRAGEVRVF